MRTIHVTARAICRCHRTHARSRHPPVLTLSCVCSEGRGSHLETALVRDRHGTKLALLAMGARCTGTFAVRGSMAKLTGPSCRLPVILCPWCLVNHSITRLPRTNSQGSKGMMALRWAGRRQAGDIGRAAGLASMRFMSRFRRLSCAGRSRRAARSAALAVALPSR